MTVPSETASVDLKEYSTVSDVEKKMNVDFSSIFGFGISKIFKLLTSFSAEYEYLNHQIKKENKTVYQAQSFVSVFNAVFAPPSFFGFPDEMKTVIQRLPNRFESEPKPYLDFIHQFGTHFISSAKFGGYIDLVFSISEKTSESTTKHKGKIGGEIEAEANIPLKDIPLEKTSFFGIIIEFLKQYVAKDLELNANGSRKLSFGGSSIKKMTESMSDLGLKLNYHGGQASLFDLENIENWEKSVPANPWLFAASLVPIYKLVNDSQKKSSMEKAMNSYLSQPYIDQLWGKVRNASNKYLFAEEVGDLELLFTRANTLKTSPVKLLTELAKLDQDIKFHLDLPEWWNETKFCYKTEPKIAGQKGNKDCPDSGPICAAVGRSEYTSFYYDKSKKDPKTHCQIQWSMVSPAYREKWFNQVQLCFSSTCTRRSENCAKINRYTRLYTDESALNTDKHGCGLRWKLRVHRSAKVPLWFKNTQLCVHLSGNFGHCKGENSQTTLCAVQNKWTQSVWDSSNDKNNGCGYQWGLFQILE